VLVFPSETTKKTFDTRKAADFFNKMQGLPYGFHTFIYEWIDSGLNNIPFKPTDPEITAWMFDTLAMWVSNDTKMGPYSLMLQGLSNRLGQKFYSMDDFWRYMEVLSSQNGVDVFTLALQVIDVPEQDSWVYWNPQDWCSSNRTGPCIGKSMVCDVFVMNVYKAAGVFGTLTDQIQAAEFGPRDTYQLSIYNQTWTGPKECDFSGEGYCQIMGKYRMPLKQSGFNSLPLYGHMNEKCGALPPDYKRFPDQC